MRFPELAHETGLRIRKLRIDLNLSPAEFAVLCHIDLDQLYELEAGKHNLCDYTLIKICTNTGTSYNDFLKGLEVHVTEEKDRVKVK